MLVWIAERRLLERAVIDAARALLRHQWHSPVRLELDGACLVAARTPEEVLQALQRTGRSGAPDRPSLRHKSSGKNISSTDSP